MSGDVLVLLADDSATVRALARMALESAGYQVLEAADGVQALALARAHRPDVVLLDVEMPVLDGHATVRALKADPDTADAPVVFLTGRSDRQDLVEALRLGGHDYLRKPPEPEELLARVAAAARVKVLQDELRRRAAELDRVTRIDFLTGLHNRRHMEEHLHALTSGSTRHGWPLSVLLLDVDHFKQVNDTVGHGGGDHVLVEVGRRLREAVRAEDVVGRWGGEEFLVVLPHTRADAAEVLGERLRAQVAAAPVSAEGRSLQVTVSIGGAGTAERTAGGPATASALLHLADAQLYLAKSAGRDRVHVAVLREP